MGSCVEVRRLKRLPISQDNSRLPPAKATATNSKISTGRYCVSCPFTGKLLKAEECSVQRKPFVACVFCVDSHDSPPVEPAETHPDKLVDFWEWLVENRTQVVLAIVIALGAGMVWYVKKIGKEQDEIKAAEEYLAAYDPDIEIDGGSTNLLTSARLQEVADDNPGTAAGINASFLAASSLFDERAYDKAEEAFEGFYSSNPSGVLASAALFGAAASRDAAGQAEGAIKGYLKVIGQSPGSPEAMQSRVALAKLYLTKATPDVVKAKELLGQVSESGQSRFVPGFWRSEAQRLSNSLESKEVVKEGLTKPETLAPQGSPKEPKKVDPPPKDTGEEKK